jgi:hypothetical protein
MDEIEIQSQDAYRAGEASEKTESRSLDDATFEPEIFVEQTEDFKQAEVIQINLQLMMANLTTEQASTMPIPIPHPEQGEESPRVAPLDDGLAGRDSRQEGPFEPAGKGDDGGEDITPINLPNIRDSVESGLGEKQVVKGTEGILETPLPGTVEEEIGEKTIGKMTEGFAETPLPGTGEEVGFKFYTKEPTGVTEVPIPSPAEEGLQTREYKSPVEQLVGNTQAAMEVTPNFILINLQMQQEMGQENRMFTLVSNIMKTKHDTAKNSINNVR